MSDTIICRKEETKILEALFKSSDPEFLAIYGRRRVGKTFLIKQFFKQKKAIFFSITGEKDGGMQKQIAHFTQRISETFYKGVDLKSGTNWDETFKLLTKAFETIGTKEKIILFLDEFPWMATQNSNLLQNLEYYWNQYWSNDKRIKLIICGSSASWIINNIINNKGGLHNRLTRNINLEPLNLYGTKELLRSRKVVLNNKQIVDLHMCMGGIPYYLGKIEKGMSSTQIIELLAFKRKGFLLEEFDNLFASLFKNSEVFVEIVKIIASQRYGIGKRKLLNKLGKKQIGKGGLEKLKALEDTGFIMDFKPLFHKEKGVYYKLIDYYTLFYLYWIAPVRETLLKRSLIAGYWDKIKVKTSWHSWSGLAFEAICYEHLPQITKALKLSQTAIPNTWRYVPRQGSNEQGAQIDLLFDRDDGSITICEIKYCEKPFVLNKDYAEKIKQKIEVFKKITRTNKQIFVSMICSSGLKANAYSEALISSVVTLDDLFKEVLG